MDRKGFLNRFVRPVLLVFIVTALSWAVYVLSPKIPSFTLYQIVAVISGIVLFISLGLGTLYVYYVSYVRGAGLLERVLAGLISPVIWMTKEVVIIGTVYSVTEAIYYYLNPVHLLLLAGVVADMGAAEILGRHRLRKGRAAKPVFSAGPVSAVVLALAWIVVMFAWGLGVHHFYIFQEGFKALFGFGAGL